MEPTPAYRSSRAILGLRGGLPITNGVKLFFHGVDGRAGEAAAGVFDCAVSPFVFAGETGSVATGSAKSSSAIFAATFTAVAAIGPLWPGGDTGAGSWIEGARAVLPRFILLLGNWRLSQSRSASAEISTPRPRNAVASTSTESPSRLSRSSSSRCVSSCAVFGCRTWRALAANSASVGGAAGAMSWCAGGSEVVMWERYAERCGSAMGVVLGQSKPRGLDVGVLTYAFLWFFVSGFTSLNLLHALNGFIFRCAEVFQFRFGGFDQLMRLEGFVVIAFIFAGWIESMICGWGCSVSYWLSPLGFCGGRLC